VGHPWLNYDVKMANADFYEVLDSLVEPNEEICAAFFEFKIQAIANDVITDFIAFHINQLHSAFGGSHNGPHLRWNSGHFYQNQALGLTNLQKNQVATVRLDLGALPRVDGGSQNMLPDLNHDNMTAFFLMDDSMVDYTELTLFVRNKNIGD